MVKAHATIQHGRPIWLIKEKLQHVTSKTIVDLAVTSQATTSLRHESEVHIINISYQQQQQFSYRI